MRSDLGRPLLGGSDASDADGLLGDDRAVVLRIGNTIQSSLAMNTSQVTARRLQAARWTWPGFLLKMTSRLPTQRKISIDWMKSRIAADALVFHCELYGAATSWSLFGSLCLKFKLLGDIQDPSELMVDDPTLLWYLLLTGAGSWLGLAVMRLSALSVLSHVKYLNAADLSGETPGYCRVIAKPFRARHIKQLLCLLPIVLITDGLWQWVYNFQKHHMGAWGGAYNPVGYFAQGLLAFLMTYAVLGGVFRCRQKDTPDENIGSALTFIGLGLAEWFFALSGLFQQSSWSDGANACFINGPITMLAATVIYTLYACAVQMSADQVRALISRLNASTEHSGASRADGENSYEGILSCCCVFTTRKRSTVVEMGGMMLTGGQETEGVRSGSLHGEL